METIITVSVGSENGYLPAKAVCKIVKTVNDSKCECFIARGVKSRTAGSALMIMALGIQYGDTVTIKCDDKNCVDKICNILQSGE